jgi:dethiobiotin synthetase
MKGFFVTGIGTDVGKTIVSAILVEALKADYWKPVQSGGLDFTDSDCIRTYAMHCKTIHPETYIFPAAKAPFFAANEIDKHIDIQYIKLPNANNNLIVEGAGGLMVPLTQNLLIKDLIIKFQLPVILVSMNYLGSINHTITTVETMRQYNIKIAGIIFNGIPNPESEEFILQYTGLKLLGKIPKADILSKGFVTQQADKLRKPLTDLLAESDNLNDKDTTLQVDYESF